MLKHYLLKKETHIIGLSNSYFDLPMLKNHVKLGYVITEVAIPSSTQDSYGRNLHKNIILKIKGNK